MAYMESTIIIAGIAAGLASTLFSAGRYFQKIVFEVIAHHEKEEWKRELLKAWRR